jgi:hypothetical protein
MAYQLSILLKLTLSPHTVLRRKKCATAQEVYRDRLHMHLVKEKAGRSPVHEKGYVLALLCAIRRLENKPLSLYLKFTYQLIF